MSTLRPTLILQATVAAGPRKDLDVDRQLGEDVVCIAQTDDRAAFCLCDGTSGERDFFKLTTRRLAQDFATEYVEASLSDTNEIPAHQRAADRMIQKWNHDFRDWWQQLDATQQSARRSALTELPDGRRAQQFSFVMICGEVWLHSRTLTLVQSGDCFGWVFTDSEKISVSPVRGRIYFEVVCCGEDAPLLRVSEALGKVTFQSFEKVCGWIAATDGVGSFRDLNAYVETFGASPAELVCSLRSVRVRTCDDRGLVTAFFRPAVDACAREEVIGGDQDSITQQQILLNSLPLE